MSLALDAARAAVLVVDVQERLAAVMPAERMAALEKSVTVLGELARRFSLPVVVSEQYPRGLGKTTAAVEAALEGLGDGLHRFEKVEFSACGAPAFAPLWSELGRDQWLVAGMETHVCVYQSVRALRERAADVHVLADAVVSRTDENRQIGLDLMARAGAVVSSTEVAAFDLLGKAGSDDFKAISRLIR